MTCISFLCQESHALNSVTEHNEGVQVQMRQENRLVICLIILKEDLFWRVI